MQMAHETIMMHLWSYVINIGIFFAIYGHSKYAKFGHIVIELFVGVVTLTTSINLLILKGIPETETKRHFRKHVILGMILLVLLGLQMLIGIISQLIRLNKNSSSTLIFILKKYHKYQGYLLIFLCKIQVYAKLKINEENEWFVDLLIIDAALLMILFIRKVKWPNMS